MILRILLFAALCVALPSCEKVRKLADRAKEVAAKKIGDSDAVSQTPDAALEALVDRNEDGAVFRKDSAFPRNLEARVTEELELDGMRIVSASMLGRQAARISAKVREVTLFERIDGHVRVTVEEASVAPLEVEGEAGATEAEGVAAAAAAVPDPLSDFGGLSGKAAVFRWHSDAWKPDPNPDFKAVAWIDALAPEFSSLLVAGGLEPRAYWFGKRRLAPGVEIPLSGAALGILFGPGAQGTVAMVLESLGHDAHGHPCGVFSVSGNVRNRRTSPAGRISDEELTIESGKVWLSMVYPLVLGYEFDTIQTATFESPGGQELRIEGPVRMKLSCEWNAGAAGG